MNRFSRNAGEALTMIKDLQKKHRIQVVSVTEGITFDYEIPGSFLERDYNFYWQRKTISIEVLKYGKVYIQPKLKKVGLFIKHLHLDTEKVA